MTLFLGDFGLAGCTVNWAQVEFGVLNGEAGTSFAADSPPHTNGE